MTEPVTPAQASMSTSELFGEAMRRLAEQAERAGMRDTWREWETRIRELRETKDEHAAQQAERGAKIAAREGHGAWWKAVSATVKGAGCSDDEATRKHLRTALRILHELALGPKNDRIRRMFAELDEAARALASASPVAARAAALEAFDNKRVELRKLVLGEG